MTFTRIPAYCCLLIFMPGLVGCATSRAANYYTLISAVAAATNEQSEIRASIGPFKLPEYLNRPQMVTRSAGTALTLEEYHRWAEPLEDLFVRTLATNVGLQLGSNAVFEFPLQRNVDGLNRVSGVVQRFDVDAGGEAILEVQWAIYDHNNKVIYTASRARYSVVAAEIGSFAARADALSATVASFAADISATLIQLP